MAIGLETGEVLVYSNWYESTRGWRRDISLSTRYLGCPSQSSQHRTHAHSSESPMSIKSIALLGSLVLESQANLPVVAKMEH